MTVTIRIQYTGELHCSLEHGPSGAHLDTDAPRDNAGRGEAFSPTDLVAAALASCAVTTMAIVGPREGIAFAGAEGIVQKEMSAEGPRRIRRLSLELRMPAGLDAAARARLEAIAQGCPVARSLSPEVDLPMRFVYPD